MTLTIGDIVIIVIVGLLALLLSVGAIIGGVAEYSRGMTIGGVIGLILTIALVIGMIFGFNWYNTSTASGARHYKDYRSNLDNGIEREITITAEDGREIFYYEGKVDIESNHEDNYIKFESEDGKRYIIYYGIQDTIAIIEK